MSKLVDVSHACDLLDSARLTDQGKGLNELKRLLEDEKVRISISKCHKSKRNPNWNTICDAISGYLRKECNGFAKHHSSWTDVSRSNKTKKLVDVFHFLKKVIRIAGGECMKLDLGSLLTFLIDLWNEDGVFVANFGIPILKIMHENMLENRKFASEISNGSICELLNICEREMRQDCEKRKFIVSSILVSLAKIITKKMDFVDNLQYNDIFLTCVKSLEKVKAYSVIENVISAANLYMNWCSITHRELCCNFGDNCLSQILQMWRENHSVMTVKHFISFCSLQISLHHPKNVVDPSLGFHAENIGRWCSHLYSILVAADLQLCKQQSGMQHRFKESRTSTLDEGCVNLAADACRIIFKMTKINKFILPKMVISGRSFVKSIDFNDVNSIVTQLSDDGNKYISDLAKPWLTVFKILLESDDGLFTYNVLKNVLIKFHHLLMNASFESLGSNSVAIIKKTFLLLSCHSKDHFFKDDIVLFSSIWKDCWNVAISCLVMANDASTCALLFLGALIEFDKHVERNFYINTGISKSSKNFWSTIYLQVPPSCDSIPLVLKFIRLYGIEYGEDEVFSTLLQTTSTNLEFMKSSEYTNLCKKNTLKALILHWLLGFKQDVINEKQNPSKYLAHTELTSTSLLVPNALCKAGNVCALVELMSELSVGLSYRISAGSEDRFSHSLKKNGDKDIVERFMEHDYVASFQYFNLELCPWLENSDNGHVEWINLPQCDKTSMVILDFLLCNMNLIIENAKNLLQTGTTNVFLKLFQSFFMYANMAGNFLYICHKTQGFLAKCFERWINCVVLFVTAASMYPKNKNFVASDDTFSDVASYLQEFLNMLMKQEKLVPDGSTAAAIKSQLQHPLHVIYQFAFRQFQLKMQNKEAVDEDSPTSHDDVLGLTQSMTSNISVKHGYRRRKYNEEIEPPSKQSRLSSTIDRSTATTHNDSSNKSDMIWDDLFLRNIIKFSLSQFFCFGQDHVVGGVIEMTRKFNVMKLTDLGYIYTVIDELSAVGGYLSSSHLKDIFGIFQNVFSTWYKDQDISMRFLIVFANIIRCIATEKDAASVEDIMGITNGMSDVFWKLKSSDKCSYLTRMGISVYLFGSLSNSQSSLTLGNEFSKILSLLSDRHSSVRCLSVFLLARLRKHDQTSTFQGCLSELLTFTSKLIAKASSKAALESGETFSLLATCLHCICVSVPSTSIDTELEAHYLLCVIESFMSKHRNLFDCKDLCSRCMAWMSNMAFKSVCNFSSDTLFLPAYKTRHLMKNLFRWLMSNSGTLFDRIEAFPCTLFGYGSMKSLCCDHVKETFPAIFCAVRSCEDVSIIYEAYFNDTCNNISLQSLLEMCLPEIFQLLSPSENINHELSEVLDELYQRKNCYQHLLSKCLGHVSVDIFMKANSDSSLESMLCRIGKLTSLIGTKAKVSTKSCLSSYVSEIIFGKRKCYLADAFTRMRFHFERSWFCCEYKHCTKAYCRFVSLLLKGSKIPTNMTGYFVGDVIAIISLNFTDIEKNFMTMTCPEKKILMMESVNLMTELLSEISALLIEYGPGTKVSAEMKKLAVLIMNLLLKSKNFCERLSGLEMDKKIITTHEKFSGVVKILTEMEVFKKLHVFIDARANPSITDCIEALQDSFMALDGLGIIRFCNPIVDNICESFVMKLCTVSELVTLDLQKKLIGSVLLMLEILKKQELQNLSVVKAIIEIYFHISKMSASKEVTSVHPESESSMIRHVMAILSEAVSSKSSDISSCAVFCVKKLLKLSDIKSYLESNSVTDSYIGGVLSSLKGEDDKKMTFVPCGIDQLKNSLPAMENTSNRNTVICSLTSSMIQFCHKSMFHILRPVCCNMERMSTVILPHVIHNILVHDPTPKAKAELSRYFNACFKAILKQPQIWNDQVHVLLNVIQHLRTKDISEIDAYFQKHGKPNMKVTSWDNNFWLQVDYLEIAKVAVCCNRPFMAILCSEIFKESTEKRSLNLTSHLTCRSLSKALNAFDSDSQHSENGIDGSQNPNEHDETMEQILIEAYCKIEDLDSLYGLAGSSQDSALMMHIHSMENNWFEALEDYNSLMTKSQSLCDADGIVKTLQYLGLAHIAGAYQNIQSISHNHMLNDRQIKASSHIGRWNDMSQKKSFSSDLDQCHSFLKNQHPSLDPLINRMREGIVGSMTSEISELSIFTGGMLDSIGKLTILRDLIHTKTIMAQGRHVSSKDYFHELDLALTVSLESSLLSSYPCADSIILNRNEMIKIAGSGMKNSFDDSIPQKLLRDNLSVLIDLATGSSREKLALHLISSAMDCMAASNENILLHSNEEYHKLQLKKTQVLWKAGRKIQAISVAMDLRNVLEKCLENGQVKKTHGGYHLAKVLQLSGKWLNEMKMESPSTIMESYFQQSVEIASSLSIKNKDGSTDISKILLEQLCVSGYKTLAKFADSQYREVIEYMTSKEFEHKRNLAREAKQEIAKANAKPHQGLNQKYVVLLQKNYKLDHQDFTSILDKREKFLLCAIENYVKCLSLSDVDDLLMYRICTLWFENTQSASLPGLMQCACSELKTHKFVDMSYQLAARLDGKSQDRNFQNTLCKLLKKLAVDHPHHVLPVLFALAYAHRDMEIPKMRQRKLTPGIEDATSKAAQSIIDEVKKIKPELVVMLGDLSDAYIEFANCDVSKFSKMTSTPINFEKHLLINKYCDSRMKDKYYGMAVPTIDIPVDKKGEYEIIMQSVSLSHFKKFFQLCGGINLPKIVVAISSDGSERKHLVKGRDDLRQDAVMQHVFKVVNALLMHNEGAHSLRMCTYKVVPLSQRSGLVEWCEGTIPIGNYLIGVPAQRNYGAHHLYRPKDLISLECRKKLHAANGKTHKQKLEVYRDVCHKFRPVFRHFFYENFLTPSQWFQCRTAYCKSVSISSIVGYILGLGDRHVQNILINRTTGEVIHIDLGVAFEQGKCLPTPEMVPFRLTRDIVDAFGFSGVEGIFRRNCERCLRVLRISIDVIATIVEVLLHDPLHDWMMTSNKAMQVQRDETNNVESEMTASVLNASTVAELLQNEGTSAIGNSSRSSLAGRALLRVKEKLRGLESGSVLSVEGQVNMLIQQATDEEKLCAMFVGWQPYI